LVLGFAGIGALTALMTALPTAAMSPAHCLGCSVTDLAQLETGRHSVSDPAMGTAL
jgi:hypothetical protein